MSKVHVHHHSATAEGAALGLLAVVVFFAVVLVVPGALLVFIADKMFSLSLDLGQLWTFAVVASAAIVAVLTGAARSAATGVTHFCLLALSVGALLLVARFGFHAMWPDQLLAAFTGHS